MSRLQLALNVDDLETSIAFYSTLFGTEPHKVRPGYANFAVAQPPLKLVLIENPGHGGSINHLGVEVEDVDTVDAELTRLAAAGFATTDERDTTCCYAKQDKFWVAGHPGRRALGGLHDHRRPAPRRAARRLRSPRPPAASELRPSVATCA